MFVRVRAVYITACVSRRPERSRCLYLYGARTSGSIKDGLAACKTLGIPSKQAWGRCAALLPAAIAKPPYYDLKVVHSSARDSWRCQLRRGVRTSKLHRLLRCTGSSAKPCCTKSQGAHRRRAPNPSRRCTDYSHRNKELRAPRGAGDTTETSLPPSEQSISRDDATAARRPLTTQHAGPRPRRN